MQLDVINLVKVLFRISFNNNLHQLLDIHELKVLVSGIPLNQVIGVNFKIIKLLKRVRHHFLVTVACMDSFVGVSKGENAKTVAVEGYVVFGRID